MPGEDGVDKGKDATGDKSPPNAVKWQVLIDCKDDDEQALLLERLRAQGYSCQGTSV